MLFYIIGLFLIVFQLLSYIGNGFAASLYNTTYILFYNIFLILGIIFIVLGVKKFKKSNQSNPNQIKPKSYYLQLTLSVVCGFWLSAIIILYHFKLNYLPCVIAFFVFFIPLLCYWLYKIKYIKLFITIFKFLYSIKKFYFVCNCVMVCLAVGFLIYLETVENNWYLPYYEELYTLDIIAIVLFGIGVLIGIIFGVYYLIKNKKKENQTDEKNI